MKKLIFLLLSPVMLLLNPAFGNETPWPTSDHFDGKKFFNPSGSKLKSFWDLLKWQWNRKKSPWPDNFQISKITSLKPVTDADTVVVTYINHATLLIQTKDFNILTDPVWSKRVSPVQWAGPKRVYDAPLELKDLPPIHFVLVSHNHYDHMDEDSLKNLRKLFNPRFLVPLGDGKHLKGFGVAGAHEMDWGNEVHVNDDLKIVFLPSEHWSARGMMDKNDCLWGSFLVIYKGKKIYFAGDTGYGDHFKQIREHYGDMDISLLPIGAYEPRWFMKDAHMNPADAVLAHLDLRSKKSIAIHFGTFQLTDEGFSQPVEDLKTALEEKLVPADQFVAVPPGGQVAAP